MNDTPTGAGGTGTGGRDGGSNRPVDPVTTSVIQGALENIATEMGHKLMRMSYSSIIRESEDFGAGLVDPSGQGLAESAQSTPLQSGPIPGYVQGMLRQMAERATRSAPATSSCTTMPTPGRATAPTSPSSCPRSTRTDSSASR